MQLFRKMKVSEAASPVSTSRRVKGGRLLLLTSLASVLLLALFQNFIVAQERSQPEQRAPEKQDISANPFRSELWNYPELDRFHSLIKSNREPSPDIALKEVRVIYLVPSDKPVRDEYKAGIADAFFHLQNFYQAELGSNRTFSLHSPIVEVYQTIHTASWYATNNPGSDFAGYFFINTLNDGFGLTGGQLNDPNYRWIFFIDADPACTQVVGANAGYAVLPANDLRGLARQQNIPPCVGQNPDNSGIYRWIGGAGHELGHSFLLPHPPACPSCGEPAYSSLMWIGYSLYPSTYLLVEDKTHLLTQFTAFFTALDLAPPKAIDFEADNKSDISVWRPSDGTWHILESLGGGYQSQPWGLAGDKLVPGDYDADKKTDVAVWRPSDGVWYVKTSSNGAILSVRFGLNGDIPVPGDYDGDGKSDFAVWRPSNGTWYVLRSATNTIYIKQFGVESDLPVAGDYNGDKRTDIAVWRPATGIWYIFDSFTGNVTYVAFGAAGDRLLPGDYDGDRKTDIAVWRPVDGNWYVRRSSNGTLLAAHFGLNSDTPVPGDYDGDGKSDYAVWRSSNTNFYILRSSDSALQVTQWGLDSDLPVASAQVR